MPLPIKLTNKLPQIRSFFNPENRLHRYKMCISWLFFRQNSNMASEYLSAARVYHKLNSSVSPHRSPRASFIIVLREDLFQRNINDLTVVSVWFYQRESWINFTPFQQFPWHRTSAFVINISNRCILTTDSLSISQALHTTSFSIF